MFRTFANAHNGYGSFVDLEAATVDQATTFFDQFYAPGNATLVVAGDLEVGPTTEMVERHFGPIAARPVPRLASFAEPGPGGARRGVHHEAPADPPPRGCKDPGAGRCRPGAAGGGGRAPERAARRAGRGDAGRHRPGGGGVDGPQPPGRARGRPRRCAVSPRKPQASPPRHAPTLPRPAPGPEAGPSRPTKPPAAHDRTLNTGRRASPGPSPGSQRGSTDPVMPA